MGTSSPTVPVELQELSFEPGRKVQSDVWKHLQRPISWPDLGPDSFTLVVSFGQCKFKLCPVTVSLILQAAIGGSAPHFKVSCLNDRTFKFFISSKPERFFVHNLRSFSYDLFSLFFHLWGSGGPNWRMEFCLFQEEERVSWTAARSTSTRKSFADVVKSPPLTSANREPLGKPKISKTMRDCLLFPRYLVFEHVSNINSGSLNQLHADPHRLAMTYLRCLTAGHPRVKCSRPICCHACMCWGHIAALCRAPSDRSMTTIWHPTIAIFCV